MTLANGPPINGVGAPKYRFAAVFYEESGEQELCDGTGFAARLALLDASHAELAAAATVVVLYERKLTRLFIGRVPPSAFPGLDRVRCALRVFQAHSERRTLSR